MLKKIVAVVCVGALACALAGCGGGQTGESAAEQNATEQVTINQSPDKYTWYVKSYAGSNLANVGYISMGDDLRDSYGAANIQLIPISTDGSYVDVSSEEALKDYVVIGQNLEPNTEIKLEFDVDENGEEYDGLVSSSSIDCIVLLVKKAGGSDKASFDIPLTKINSCPGPETRYVQDYVGRNLAAAGYISMGGDLRDTYGKGNVKLVPTADDGAFIDVEDVETLKQYRIVSQNVAPNTEITFSFEPDYGYVESQSLQEIELKVTKVAQ